MQRKIRIKTLRQALNDAGVNPLRISIASSKYCRKTNGFSGQKRVQLLASRFGALLRFGDLLQ
jgi:hypothetical protein